MRKTILALLAALLASYAGLVLAQTLTLTNLKGPIAKITGEPEAKTIAGLWEQIGRAVTRATPAPTPTPAPAEKPVVLAEGDSISLPSPGGYIALYTADHPDVDVRGKAVAGSSIGDLVNRLPADLALHPFLVTVLIGANDLGGGQTADEWLAGLWSYVAKLKASGAKVAVGTVLPVADPPNPTDFTRGVVARHKAKRPAINAAIRAAVGNKFDAVIDYAADPDIGPDAAAADKRWYQDGTHPTEAGQAHMAAIYAPVVDKLLGKGGAPETSPAAFVPTVSIAPSLEGLAPIASGVNIAANLRPAWGTGAIPGLESPGMEEGAFRFICAPGQVSYDDPIVYPGQPGKSHLHQWFGNLGGNAYSTYASLRTSGESTCNNLLNRSAYWIPAMMHPGGKVVPPDAVSIYYKRAPAGSKFCAPPYAKACLALPRGLRYIFGYNMLDPTRNDPDGARWFRCDAPNAPGDQFRTIAAAAAVCPAGGKIGAIIVGPTCWNGRDLDSADHRSHMAYIRANADGVGVCPATHPYQLPFFELGAWYHNDGTANQWRLSSDMPGMVAGTTFHADWFGAWEDSIKDRWTANCINKALSCTGGDLGDGTQLQQFAGYDFPNGRPLVDAPTR